MRGHVESLIDAATKPYLQAGRYAYHFARGKLTHDPVFLSLLRSGRIPDGSRVLDLGCGHAVLASLLLAAGETRRDGAWPPDWIEPPLELQWQGIESQRSAAQRAQLSLGDRVRIDVADLREAALPDADVVLLIDVLHYLPRRDQTSLLARVAHSLRDGGLLILRVADASAGWRFHAGRAADVLGSMFAARGAWTHHHRSLEEWMQLLGGIGFETSVEPPGDDKSFANVVLWAAANPHAEA